MSFLIRYEFKDGDVIRDETMKVFCDLKGLGEFLTNLCDEEYRQDLHISLHQEGEAWMFIKNKMTYVSWMLLADSPAPPTVKGFLRNLWALGEFIKK
jgi:hypothetical protein